jgi:hypothetical protein
MGRPRPQFSEYRRHGGLPLRLSIEQGLALIVLLHGKAGRNAQLQLSDYVQLNRPKNSSGRGA